MEIRNNFPRTWNDKLQIVVHIFILYIVRLTTLPVAQALGRRMKG